jgi:hypothetical protein
MSIEDRGGGGIGARHDGALDDSKLVGGFLAAALKPGEFIARRAGYASGDVECLWLVTEGRADGDPLCCCNAAQRLLAHVLLLVDARRSQASGQVCLHCRVLPIVPYPLQI